MSNDHYEFGSFWTSLYFFDMENNTNYSDYLEVFTKDDNEKFKKLYGCYPVNLDISNDSVKKIEAFIEILGESHFFYSHKGFKMDSLDPLRKAKWN